MKYHFFKYLNYTHFNKKFLKDNKFFFNKINLVYAWSKYLLTSYSNNNKLISGSNTNKIKLKEYKISKIKIFFFIYLSRLVGLYPNKTGSKFLFYINAKHFDNKAKLFCKTLNLKASKYVPIISDINKINIFNNNTWLSKYHWKLGDFINSKRFIKKVCENIYNDIRLLKPKIIFVFEGDSYIHNIIGNCTKGTDTKVIIIQNGYNIYKKLPVFGWRNMSANYYLSWSKHNTNKLKKYNPNIKFITVGNFQQYKKYRINKKNKARSISFILAKEENKKFIKFINNFAILNKKINIIIRLHPNSKIKFNSSFSDSHNIYFHKNEDLDKTLALSKIVISKMSSVLIETLKYDSVGVCFNKNYKDLIFDDLQSEKMMVCCKNDNELSKKLNLLSKDSNYFNGYVKQIKKKRKDYISNFDLKSKRKIKNIINV